jgi:SAM-dependent methyltransferase
MGDTGITAATSLLRCPTHGEPLSASGSMLDCPQEHSFPVRDGIPRFVFDEEYSKSFGFQWERHAETQLDSHNGFHFSRERWFRCTRWPDRMDGELMLEAGSGPGRFTEVAATTGAILYTFDFSRAIDVNRANHATLPSVTFLQADMTRPPFAPESFDRVFCMGVLQHTPDPGKSFSSLARLVRPGGSLAIDVYQKTAIALFHWKYALRPLTTRLNPALLYGICERAVPPLLPAWKFLRRIGGRYATRLLPIVSYSQLGIPDDLNRAWSVLDTFDMYSPAFDRPQTRGTVHRWFREAGFEDIEVAWGPNGIVGRGRKRPR